MKPILAILIIIALLPVWILGLVVAAVGCGFFRKGNGSMKYTWLNLIALIVIVILLVKAVYDKDIIAIIVDSVLASANFVFVLIALLRNGYDTE